MKKPPKKAIAEDIRFLGRILKIGESLTEKQRGAIKQYLKNLEATVNEVPK